MQLVLSLFPGIGLLDMAFEFEGFCVVRGPDLLWGGDVRRFHPPAGRFDGVIGGPPCQVHSIMGELNKNAGDRHGDLIPEFARVVGEAAPEWFVMENVPDAPLPAPEPYEIRSTLVRDVSVGGLTRRLRRFTFGSIDGSVYRFAIEGLALHSIEAERTVTAGHGAVFAKERGELSIERMCELQGLPTDFLYESPLTAHGKRKVIGNGVPLPMGRAVARAVKRALGIAEEAA